MFTETARAKINLTLEVLGKRNDGYHELSSLVAFADYGDELSWKPAPSTSLIIDGPFAMALEGENLIETAANFLKQRYPELPDGTFHLTKNLPVASGIGGGSADAAAAIRLLIDQASINIDKLNFPALASKLGADIPVCIRQQPVLVTGMGETLKPVGSFPKLPAVLVNPGIPVPTGPIFKKLNAPTLPEGYEPAPVAPTFGSVDDMVDYMNKHPNHLQAVAEEIEPVITDVLNCLREQDGCLVARMSGSGATCFAFFMHFAAAETAAEKIAKLHSAWWVRDCCVAY